MLNNKRVLNEVFNTNQVPAKTHPPTPTKKSPLPEKKPAEVKPKKLKIRTAAIMPKNEKPDYELPSKRLKKD